MLWDTSPPSLPGRRSSGLPLLHCLLLLLFVSTTFLLSDVTLADTESDPARHRRSLEIGVTAAWHHSSLLLETAEFIADHASGHRLPPADSDAPPSSRTALNDLEQGFVISGAAQSPLQVSIQFWNFMRSAGGELSLRVQPGTPHQVQSSACLLFAYPSCPNLSSQKS